MSLVRARHLVPLLFLLACSGGQQAEAEGQVAQPQAEPPPALELSADQLADGGENIALVPSPIETQRAVEAAGIATQLHTLLDDRTFEMQNDDLDNVAVRTGVVIANLLLTVKSAPTDQVLARLQNIRTGMEQLEGGSDIDRTIEDMHDRLQAGALTPDDLLRELDEISGAVIPELEFNGRERVVPLIQAGSWLQGANLVAKAVKQAEKPDAADNLLKQPAVVDHFIQYVRTEGADRAPAAITEKLEASLTALKDLSEKAEPFTDEDIDQVIQTTNDVLALL